MVLVVMMTGLVVVWMMVVLKLGHLLHRVPLVILPIHHNMLSLMPTMLVHVESAVGPGWICRRSGWRGCIIIEGPPSTLGRNGTVKIPLGIVLVVLIVELPGPRLVEPVLTICHLMRYSERWRGETWGRLGVCSRDTVVIVLSRRSWSEVKESRHAVFVSCTWTLNMVDESIIGCSLAELGGD